MAFFNELSGKSMDKLFNRVWTSFFHNEPTETWDEKCYYWFRKYWNNISNALELLSRQIVNYWQLYATIFASTLIVLAIHKSLRYLGAIKFREKDNSENRIEEQTCSDSQERGIVSNNDNEDDDDEKHKDKSFVESCPTFPSHLDDGTTTRDNDQLDNQREASNISSETTIVPDDVRNKKNNFLKEFINSIESGHDDEVDNNIVSNANLKNEDDLESSDLPENSTMKKLSSDDLKKYYFLTPWIETSEQLSSSGQTEIIDNNKNIEESVNYHWNFDDNINDKELKIKEEWEIDKNLKKEPETDDTNVKNCDESDLGENIINSTLDDDLEKKSVGSSDDSLITNTFVESRLPKNDISLPIHSQENIELRNDSESINKPEIRTDSKHRFRSFSHDDRPISAVYVENRRGGSLSPPSRNRNKQRSTKHAQSKIPTLIPPVLITRRTMQHYREIDGSTSEATKQIRLALLRKFREVWVQHSRDKNQFFNRCKNPSNGLNDSSIDPKTPEAVSRIPLPRKSSRDHTSP